MLVIDDGSPDGTGAIVRKMAAADPSVTLIERAGKLGLGSAYREGFKAALRGGYDCAVGMDSDFSHDPAVLPELIAAAEQHPLVIGSRYAPGG